MARRVSPPPDKAARLRMWLLIASEARCPTVRGVSSKRTNSETG